MRTQLYPLLPPVSRETLTELSQTWSVPIPIAEWLWRRGIRTLSDFKSLTAEPEISSPYLLPDMSRAVAVLEQALTTHQSIRIHGDYDADGVTATAVMLRGLRELDSTAVVDFHIPNRFDEGYGLSEEAVLQAADDGVQLLITVDCGSSSQEAAALAATLGLRLLITDHHGLSSPLPRAEAVVNPERMANPNRFSGAGVAFQLIRALSQQLNLPISNRLLAIAAIGTVADVVPLRGDNRALVAMGLAQLRLGQVKGVNMLVERIGRSRPHLQASDLAFYLGPRLNAVGRMADAAPAVALLINDHEPELPAVVDQLEAANHQRREVERQLLDQAWLQLDEWQQGGRTLPPFVVVGGSGWHHGVIGIVASRLKESLRSPVAVIGWQDDEGKGSARSVDGLDLLTHLRGSGDAFLKLGGHRGAAGFSLTRQSLPDLARRLSRDLPKTVIRQRYQGPPIDGRYSADDLSVEVSKWLERLEPTGHGFEPPRWMVRGTIGDVHAMGAGGDHLRFHWVGAKWPAIAFQSGSKVAQMPPGGSVWAVGQLQWDTFKNRRQLRFRCDQVLTPAKRRSWKDTVKFSPPPEHLSGLVLWVVGDQSSLVQLSRRGVPSYSWTHPLAERAVLSHQVERGLIAAVALSQWRPWPEWEEVAEHIVWLCRPFSQEALGLAANLLTTTGTQWLDPQWINAKSQDGVLTKWRRLVPDRDRLSSLWRLKRSGYSPMMAGQAIFQELGLDPQAFNPQARRDLMDSPSYRYAWTLRTSAEAEISLQPNRGI